MLLEIETARLLSHGFGQLKRVAFGIEDVEIKSNWLRIEKERRRRYLDRYKVTDDQLDAFVDSYYQALIDADLVLLACVVDKVHMHEKYGDLAWYPPAAAYEPLLQRAQQCIVDGV